MKNRKYIKTTTNKITVKGMLSEDCSFITFISDDKEEETVTLEKCLAPFAGKEIVFSMSDKFDEDLEEELEEV